MVEINNQRKAFLDMLAWSERLITDVRKPEIMVMTSLANELFTDYSDHPRKLVTLTKTQINRRRTQLLSRWWDAYRKRLGLKDFSRKVRTLWHYGVKERGALPMIDRGDMRQAIDRAAISGLTAGRWLWSVRA